MANEYEREFGKFPWRQEPVHMWPSMSSWTHELRKRGFDADAYVLLGHVNSTLGDGHGGIRFGESGWAWMVGLGKVFGHKSQTLVWSDVDFLTLRRDPFSIAVGNQSTNVDFVAIKDTGDFVTGEMADVFIKPFDNMLKSGEWKEPASFPQSSTGAYGGQVEAMWVRDTSGG